jgi:glycosyl-4,4'-diaponeurosporenoate acyltransferase
VLIRLPGIWIIGLNLAGWCGIQFGLAWLFLKLPVGRFNPAGEFGWERNGKIYQSLFRVKSWLPLLPDGGGWFPGGFRKGALLAGDRDYLYRFLRETRRGELCHWAAIGCSPLFFLWNPLWGDVVIVAYALAANLPCIIAQRYNRIRIRRVLRDGPAAKLSRRAV